MLDAIRRVAPRISDYGDFTWEVGALSADAYANGRQLPGALFLRSAEFFILPDEPAKTPARQRFREKIEFRSARHDARFCSSTCRQWTYRLRTFSF